MDIYNMVIKKATIVENASVCQKHKIFGYYSTPVRRITMCTENIKKFSGLQININETFMHEAVHIAQSCKAKFRGLEAFGISPSLMRLSDTKEKSLKQVIAFDSRLKNIDREAFWMEDKPEKVKYVVRKYCF